VSAGCSAKGAELAQVQRIAPVCLPREYCTAVSADTRENAAEMLYNFGKLRVKVGQSVFLCERCGLFMGKGVKH